MPFNFLLLFFLHIPFLPFVVGLDHRAADLVQEGWAPRSKAGYATAVRRYLNFAQSYSMQPLPLSETKLLRFIAYLDLDSLSHRTVSTYLSGLRAWVIAIGLQPPVIWSPRVKLAVRSLVRNRPPPSQAAPISFPLLCSMLRRLTGSPDALVLASAMALQYFGCLRASELCVDPLLGKGPARSSVSFSSFKGRPLMRYAVASSKTQPHGFVVCLGCSGKEVCAVCLIYLLVHSSSSHSHLFTLASGQPLTYPVYNSAIKALIKDMGMDPLLYSSHSLRAGAATQAATTGMPAHDIQRLGRWRSSAYTLYMRPVPESFALLAPQLT